MFRPSGGQPVLHRGAQADHPIQLERGVATTGLMHIFVIKSSELRQWLFHGTVVLRAGPPKAGPRHRDPVAGAEPTLDCSQPGHPWSSCWTHWAGFCPTGEGGPPLLGLLRLAPTKCLVLDVFRFCLEKEMATQYSSTLAWRIPGMEEPGGLPSMGSHRVRHD